MAKPASARPIRVLAVDDHPVLREGIAAILEAQADITLVGTAENGIQAIEQYHALRPDIVLMDLQMPQMGGIEAIETIHRDSPKAHIIVLTTYDGDVQAVRALKAGAAAYLLKSSLRRELLDTIRAVHTGRRFVPPDVAQQIALHAADEPLSKRELSILVLVADGKANKEIAWALSISEETVKAHMKSIFSKLDVADRTHAVTAAIRRGIIEL